MISLLRFGNAVTSVIVLATLKSMLSAPANALASSMAARKTPKGNDNIYLGKYDGWYAVRDEAYYDESELKQGASGEKLSPQGTPVEWVEEESYFFKLSAYQQKLLDLYERVPDFVLPRERLNEVASFVKGGLQDLSISRTTFNWGIKVPGNPKHIMYVWVDALTNYITAAGFPDDQSAKFKRYWPADLHVIGKDIVRFHAVYWPAFLMSAGIDVPRRIFSHGFLFNRGEKMSKSVGNVIDPFTMADAYGVDQMRYFFLREVPFGQDGNYSHEAIVARINADLANDLGNGHARVQRRVGILEDHLHAPAQRRVVGAAALARHVVAIERDRARGRRIETDHQARHRRLATAGLAHQREGLALGDLDVDAVDRLHDLAGPALQLAHQPRRGDVEVALQPLDVNVRPRLPGGLAVRHGPAPSRPGRRRRANRAASRPHGRRRPAGRSRSRSRSQRGCCLG